MASPLTRLKERTGSLEMSPPRDISTLGSPLRVSKLRSLSVLDPKQTLDKIRGREIDLQSPLVTAPGSWVGGERHAAREAKQKENRLLRDLKSKRWDDRKRACEHFGQTASLQNFRVMARLVDVIVTERDGNVLDAALRALLRINGCLYDADEYTDNPGQRSPDPPLQSSAGLPTPLSRDTGVRDTPVHAHGDASAARPSSAHTVGADLFAKPGSDGVLVGARPLGQWRQRALVESASSPLRNLTWALRFGKRGDGPGHTRDCQQHKTTEANGAHNEAESRRKDWDSPLMSPLMHEWSKRKRWHQKRARQATPGTREPTLAGSRPASALLPADKDSLRPDSSCEGKVMGQAPLRRALRPNSAPAMWRAGHLSQVSAARSATTIGHGRTVYDDDSYNLAAAPSAEHVLGSAIDRFAAGAAVDAVARHAIKQLLWDVIPHGGCESSRKLAVQCVEHGLHGLFFDEELRRLVLAMAQRSDNVLVTRDAAYLLGILAQPDDAQVIAALSLLLRHRDEMVRQRACLSLAPLSQSPDCRQAIETLAALADEDQNEDVKKAALYSLARLAHHSLDAAVASLVKGSQSDDILVCTVAVEGLILVAPTLSRRLKAQEARLTESQTRVAKEEALLQDTSQRVSALELAVLDTKSLLKVRLQEVNAWATSIAIHPAVNMCRAHFSTEAFLRETLALLNRVLLALRFVQGHQGYTLGAMYRERLHQALVQLTSMSQDPSSYESMHQMLSTLVVNMGKANMAQTMHDLENELDVHVGRLDRQLRGQRDALEEAGRLMCEHHQAASHLRRHRQSVLQALSGAEALPAVLQQAVFHVLEQLGERNLLLRSASRCLAAGCLDDTRAIARGLVLDLVQEPADEVVSRDKDETVHRRQEFDIVMVESVEQAFENLRRRYYETASLQTAPVATPDKADVDVSLEDGGKGWEAEADFEAAPLDASVTSLMTALADLVGMMLSPSAPGDAQQRIWHILCRQLGSGAWPLQQVACVSMANCGAVHASIKATPDACTCLCDMLFHQVLSVRNAAVAALKVVSLPATSVVHMLSRIVWLAQCRSPQWHALRAIMALFSRQEAGGSISPTGMIAREAVRTLLRRVEQTPRHQALRDIARQGLFLLEGRQLSYEESRTHEATQEQRLQARAQQQGHGERTKKQVIFLGDIVVVQGLTGAQSRYNSAHGEVTAFEMGHGQPAQHVWVKLSDKLQRQPVKCDIDSCLRLVRGLEKGDYVLLNSLPKIHSRYKLLTGLVVGVLLKKGGSRVERLSVKLPDAVRLLPLTVHKSGLVLKAKRVHVGDRVLLKFLVPQYSHYDGMTAQVSEVLFDKEGTVNRVKIAAPALTAASSSAKSLLLQETTELSLEPVPQIREVEAGKPRQGQRGELVHFICAPECVLPLKELGEKWLPHPDQGCASSNGASEVGGPMTRECDQHKE